MIFILEVSEDLFDTVTRRWQKTYDEAQTSARLTEKEVLAEILIHQSDRITIYTLPKGSE